MTESSRVLRRRAAAWLLGWLLSASLYLLLIDITDLPELLVGAGITIVAASGFVLAREQYLVAETAQVSWLIRAYRPLIRAPGDIVTVSLAALAQLIDPQDHRGRWCGVAFQCGESDARRAGRLALAESLGSFAPNSIVVGADFESNLLLAHQLRRRADRRAVDVLELG